MERVKSDILCLEGGSPEITYYHLVLKESIQLQKEVPNLVNMRLELATKSGMRFVWSLVGIDLSEYSVANVGGAASVGGLTNFTAT